MKYESAAIFCEETASPLECNTIFYKAHVKIHEMEGEMTSNNVKMYSEIKVRNDSVNVKVLNNYESQNVNNANENNNVSRKINIDLNRRGAIRKTPNDVYNVSRINNPKCTRHITRCEAMDGRREYPGDETRRWRYDNKAHCYKDMTSDRYEGTVSIGRLKPHNINNNEERNIYEPYDPGIV